jgi:hypothetical protein
MRSKLKTCAAALTVSLPWIAAAQPVSMPTQVADVFSVEVGGVAEHHSNLFRVPGGPSDTLLRGLLGVRFERELSLQRFTGYLNIAPVKYLDYSSYDYVGWAGGVIWDWELGRPVFGRFSATYDRTQSAFDAVGFAQNNLQTTILMRALAGFRMTQAWSLIGAVDHRTFENSLATQSPADSTRTGFEFGSRYAPGNALEVDFVYRRESAELPNRQVFDSTGNLLPGAIDNAFSQDAALMRMSYRPTDVTRITGNVGFTRRSYDNVPQRDFSGITGGLELEWPLSGAVLMRAAVFRTLDSAELLTASYADVLGFALRPTWTLTSRITLDGLLVWDTRSYQGDPGFVISGAAVRKDRFTDLGVRLNYEFARRVFLYSDIRRTARASNYATYEFTDNWFTFGVRAAF